MARIGESGQFPDGITVLDGEGQWFRASNKMTVHLDLGGADTGDGEAFDRR